MKLTKSTIATGIILVFGTNVWADSGTYESVTSMSSNWTTMEHLDGTVTVGSQNGTSTVIKSSGGPYVEGESNIFVCLAYIRNTSAGMDLESSCTATRASGEKIFMLSRRKAGDVAESGGGKGVSTFVGGTGQFEGISGRCMYTVDYLPGNEMVSRATCNWQTP